MSSNNCHAFSSGHPPEETVAEVRERLNKIKKLLQESEARNEARKNRAKSYRCKPLLDANFVSAIFIMAFLLIVGVSFYAFQNLYFAIMKKFPAKHTEL